MKLWVLGSGSGGNAVLIECDETRVLIDAGFSARRLAERMRHCGVDPASIDALLLTHEHSDHISGVTNSVKRWGWPVFGTAGTLAAVSGVPPARRTTIAAGAQLTIGSLTLETTATSHDAAEPVAYVATAARTGMRAAVVTDLGAVTDGVRSVVREVDVLVLESNHDVEMLHGGPYPYHLKRRIASQHGHLSNVDAGKLMTEVAHRGLQQLVLAHLSETNNTPRVAVESMQAAVRRTRWRGKLTAAPQHGVVGPFGDASAVGSQLSLAL